MGKIMMVVNCWSIAIFCNFRAGDIRANSADHRMLPEERRKAKALMEDIATKEHELKVGSFYLGTTLFSTFK